MPVNARHPARLQSGLRPRLVPRLAAAFAALLVAACGGGGGSSVTEPPASCSTTDQQAWLGRYMDDWYFWSAVSPRPDASTFDTVAAYFDALLFQGDATFPADRWSGAQSTESFNRFFGEGESLGWGVSVAGLEVAGRPDAPLFVRHVEPLSPAAAQGVARGDEVLAIGERTVAELIASDGLGAALTAQSAGQVLTLRLRRAGAERSVVLSAAVFALTPVAPGAVVTSPGGRRLGYLAVKDMISTALAPVDAAFAAFQAAHVDDVVLDLRYNGGGLVSVGARIAAYIPGASAQDRTYAALRFNARRAAASDQTFRFDVPAAAVGLPRVFVLTGQRTCSAAEQVINGLRGIGVEVVSVGDTSCGKPVGFVPASQCGTTYSVVNFESVNAAGDGRYFDGLPATCVVDEDFGQALGSADEPLLAAAARYADSGTCPASASGGARQAGRQRGARADGWDGAGGMVPR